MANARQQPARRGIGPAGAALAGSALAGLLGLAGCGGGFEAAPAALEDPQAQRVVAASDLPALAACLSRAMRSLDVGIDSTGEILRCATGTYTGHTDDGTDCHLRVAAQPARLSFSVGSVVVGIDAQIAAYRADALPLRNIEATPLDDDRPGVMLTRYAAAEALTESIALRAGAGGGAPQLIHLRVLRDAVQAQRCNFAG
jgi:hypothetical protein